MLCSEPIADGVGSILHTIEVMRRFSKPGYPVAARTQVSRNRVPPLKAMGLLAAPLLMAAIAGCTADATRPNDAGGLSPDAAAQLEARRAMDIATLRGVGLNQPPVAGAVGMEVRSWSVRPTSEDLESAIAVAALEPADIGGDALLAWDRLGVRVMQVRIERLAAFHAAMAGGPLNIASSANPVSTRPLNIERQWINQGPRWSEAVRGASVAPGSVITLDQSRLVVDGGQVRLLARCWVTPGLAASAERTTANGLLAVELLPQLQDFAGRAEDSLLPSRSTTRAESQGLSFERLTLRSRLAPGMALVLLPKVAPRAEEQPAEPSRRAPRAGEVATLDAPPAKDDPRPSVRPIGEEFSDPPEPPTLGQLLLGGTGTAATDVSAPSGQRRQSAVIIVVPSVPERFRLLP